MRTWELVLPLERAHGPALFLQIARAVAEHIRAGRLRPGDPLPGTRGLAESLGVHRNTVIAAFRELEAEGWIRTSRARGTFVSSALPDPTPQEIAPRGGRNGGPATANGAARAARRFALRPGPERWTAAIIPAGTRALVGGKPDLALVPMTSLARAYRRTLQRNGTTVMGYGDPRGHERLRAAIAAMLASTRGLPATADDVIVTRGSQMAVFLIARALFGPGDVVAVESFGYRPAWEALKGSGARLLPIPVDESGMQVSELAKVAAKEKVRAVYLTPHHQFPTTVSLSPGRRLELLQVVRRRDMTVIEDDYDHEFHYEGRPILPLASVEPGGRIIYVGTLSKVLAPGVRAGYVVAPPEVVERLATHRSFIDITGDHAIEAALAELFEDGEVQRHVRRARRVYMARRDTLVQALRKELGDRVSFEIPTGGMAIWCRVHGGVDVDAWLARAARAGVWFQTAKLFTFDGRPRPCVRLGFAPLPEKEIVAAVKIMAKVMER